MEYRRIAQLVMSELLYEGNEVEIPAFGLSMFPFLLPGTIIRIKRCKLSQVNKGDIILFTRDNKIVLHRCIKRDNNMIYTKGDSLVKSDTPFSFDNYLGKLIAYKRRNEFQSVNNKSFQYYARMILLVKPVSGYFLRPLSFLWYKLKGYRMDI